MIIHIEGFCVLLPNGMLYRLEDRTTIQMTIDLMKVASDDASAVATAKGTGHRVPAQEIAR